MLVTLFITGSSSRKRWGTDAAASSWRRSKTENRGQSKSKTNCFMKTVILLFLEVKNSLCWTNIIAESGGEMASRIWPAKENEWKCFEFPMHYIIINY